MSSQDELEKEYSERLDDLLAGRNAGIEQVPDAELRVTLDFSRRMGAVCVRPTPQFQSALKSRLLQKLADEETVRASRRGWLGRLFEQPVMRLAVALVLVAAVSTGLWLGGVFNGGGNQAPAPSSPLAVSASTDKPSYAPGENVLINVTLTNATDEDLVFAQYPPILSLMDAVTKQAVYTFKTGSASDTLAPSQTASFTLTWNQRTETGSLVSSGRYYIELEDLYYQGHAVKLTLAQPASFDILPAS
jgi:hypothetical protein